MTNKVNFYKLFLLLFLLLFSGNYVLAARSGSVGIGPYQEIGQERRSWFVYKVQPGDVIKDTALVVNYTDKPADILIYAVDARTTKDGAYAPNADDAPRINVSSWIKLEKSELSLAAGEETLVNFTLAVPEKVAVGDHFGTILVRQKKPITRQDGESAFNLIIRVGVRIYVTVKGDLIKKLTFNDFYFGVDKTKKPYFYFDIANEGNVRLTPNGKVDIYKNNGKLVESFPATLMEIFPYTTTTVGVLWKNPISGKFKAQATVFGPNNEKFTKEIEFKWTVEGDQEAFIISRLNSNIVFAFTAILLLLIGVILFLLKKKRR